MLSLLKRSVSPRHSALSDQGGLSLTSYQLLFLSPLQCCFSPSSINGQSIVCHFCQLCIVNFIRSGRNITCILSVIFLLALYSHPYPTLGPRGQGETSLTFCRLPFLSALCSQFIRSRRTVTYQLSVIISVSSVHIHALSDQGGLYPIIEKDHLPPIVCDSY